MMGWIEVNDKPIAKPKEILAKKVETEKFVEKDNKNKEEE